MKKNTFIWPLFILFIVSSTTCLQAQISKIDFSKRIANAPLIIEGEVISKKSF